MIKVLGIKIIDRIKEVGLTQLALSRHASVITTRLGFHEVTDNVCSREAYIILHLKDEYVEIEKLTLELASIGGIEIREMLFSDKVVTTDPKVAGGSTEILGVMVERDPEVIAAVQRIFTFYGCNIRTRLGVNEVFYGMPAGLIILELTGDQKQRDLLEEELSQLNKVQVKKMVF